MKTTIHVAIFSAGLVEVDVVPGPEGLIIDARVERVSKSEISGAAMPSLRATNEGVDASNALHERITQIAAHLVLKEVEAALVKTLKDAGSKFEGQVDKGQAPGGASA